MDKYPEYISQELQETFERRLLGHMEPQEEHDFDKKLLNDKELCAQFEEFKSFFYVVEEQGLRNVLDKFHEGIGTAPTNMKLRLLAYRIAAGIAVLLALSIWWYNRPNTNERLYNSYFSPDPGLPTVMGTHDNYSFYEAMVDYKQGNYKKAIKKWEKLLLSKPTNDTLQYFLGASYMATENMEKAILRLAPISDASNSIFYEDINLYLGLAFLKKNDIEKAKLSLSKSTHPKSKDLLSQIK